MEHPLPAKEITDLIDREIKNLLIPEQPKRLYDPIRYILSLGGKRIRPLLALMSYNLFANSFDTILKPALSIELFHNFSLVHDDIMDKAPIRRGKETVHIKWDDNVAILSGDAMLVQAYEYLEDISAEHLVKTLKSFNRSAREVCEGQQLDMDFEERSLIDQPVSENEYMNMIRLKTAVLFGFSLELGGVLGDANEEVCNQLYEAGVQLGLAFQLQDDLLDLYGGEKFGKQVGGDILNAKKTFMLVKALELSSTEDHDLIIATMNDSLIEESIKIDRIKGVYDHYEISKLAQSQIAQHLDKFKVVINQVSTERGGSMLKFVESITNRAV